MTRALGRPLRLAPYAVAFSLVVLIVFVALAGRTDGLGPLRELDPGLILAAVALHVTAHVMWGARLALIARGLGTPMSWMRGWHIVTAGVFGGAVTPGRIGGEAVKLTLLVRRGEKATQASRVLVADRSIDLAFFLVMGLVAAALLPGLFGETAGPARPLALLGSLMLAVFLLLIVLLLAWPRGLSRAARPLHRRWPAAQERLEGFLRGVRQGLGVLWGRPGLMAPAFALTLLNWLAEYAVLWVLLQAFGHTLPYPHVFLVGVVLTMVSNIPVSPGGAGVAETAAAALLIPLAPGLSLLFPVAWRVTTYWYDLILGGAVAAWSLPRARPGRQKNEAPEDE